MDKAARARLAAVPDNDGFAAALFSLREQVSGDMRQPLLLRFGGVVAVLLIACANDLQPKPLKLHPDSRSARANPVGRDHIQSRNGSSTRIQHRHRDQRADL